MRKSMMGFIATILIIVGVITSSAFTYKGEATAATSTVANQGWSKDFYKAVKVGDLFVTNDKGNRVTAAITLRVGRLCYR